MTVVKNTLVARATASTRLKGFETLLEGPSAVIYGKGVAIATIAKRCSKKRKSSKTPRANSPSSCAAHSSTAKST